MNDVERRRGKRLAELRQAAGLTQPQVAAAFDISKQAVGEWESGKSSPDRRKLLRLDRLYLANGAVLALFDVTSEDATKLRDVVGELARVVLLLAAKADVELDADLLRALVPDVPTSPRSGRRAQ